MKHKYKTKKRGRQSGSGVINGIPGSLDVKIKYMKKCSPGKIMCDKDEKNYALCVNDEAECDNVDYDYEYTPTDPSDPNGLKGISGSERNPMNLERFHIEYDEKDNLFNPEDSVLAKKLLENDVKINEATGRKKSYAPEFFPTSCYIQKKPMISHTYPDLVDAATVPATFKILTQNALGLYFGKKKSLLDESNPSDSKNKAILDIMELRTAYLRKCIADYDYPDFLCFQEMSTYFFDFLYTTRDFENRYEFVYPSKDDFDTLRQQGADQSVMLISKYPAIKTTTYMLQGNSSYYNALGVYEFNNLIIFNCYLQAGSEISPGQKYNWENYSRCRRQQLMFIKKIIEDSGSDKPVVVLGDFNSELNALGYGDKPRNIEKWSELKFLADLGLKDSYRDINPNDAGLTENTHINSLRFLGKLEEKELRYDGIFYNNKLKPLSSTVVTDEPLVLNEDVPAELGLDEIVDYNSERINQQFKKAMVFEPPPENVSAVRKKEDYIENHNGGILKTNYELFVSDHFGVMTKFEIETVLGGKRTRRRKRNHKKRRITRRRKL